MLETHKYMGFYKAIQSESAGKFYIVKYIYEKLRSWLQNLQISY